MYPTLERESLTNGIVTISVIPLIIALLDSIGRVAMTWTDFLAEPLNLRAKIEVPERSLFL